MNKSNIIMNDPNHVQARASNPNKSIWVSASAGTGKTKILIDRIVSLLLNKVNLSEIICITFTDNASKEMKERLLAKLAQFATSNIDDLTIQLENLLKNKPSEEQIKTAQVLFSQAVNNPQDIKIQTIHSFCQNLLARFPNESNAPINFKIIDESESNKLKIQAISNTLEELFKTDNIEIINNIKEILKKEKEGTLNNNILEILKNTIQLEETINQYKLDRGFLDIYKEKIYQIINIDINTTSEDILNKFSQNLDLDSIIQCMQTLINHNINISRKKFFPQIVQQKLISLKYDFETPKAIKLLKSMLLTDTNTTTPLIKKPDLEIPEIAQVNTILQDLAKNLENMQIKEQEYVFAQNNVAFMYLAVNSYKNYNIKKYQQSYLDNNDSIIKTHNLLQTSNDIMPWIMFKLDSQIKHILIDEAQDTSPQQWKIINFFVKEFFSGQSAFEDKQKTHTLARTLFVVGDLKQSIYSFQGANAQEFINKRAELSEIVTNSQQNWENVDMKTSFRSSSCIIKAVNTITNNMFSNNDVYKNEDLEHISYQEFVDSHNSHNSRVEIWPIVHNTPADKELAKTPIIKLSRFFISSKNILNKIQAVIQEDNTITYGDMVILYRSRSNNHLLPILTKTLKDNNIPILGVDKLYIKSNIGVMDLLALGKFILLNNDNLSLACVLKSPMFGLDDNDLLNLTNQKSTNLYTSLKNIEQYNHIYGTLNNWINLSKTLNIYNLYFHILYIDQMMNKFVDRLGKDCLDPIADFLNLSVNFKDNKLETLQNFLYYIEKENPLVSRDISTSENAISFSTVHSYKGLQKKVVFLINDMDEPIKNPKIITPENTMIYISSLSSAPANIVNIVEFQKTQLQEEEKRLLYVAITRASYQMYICNIVKKYDVAKTNQWYKTITNEHTLNTFEQNNSDLLQNTNTAFLYIEQIHKKSTANTDLTIQKNDSDSEYPTWYMQNPIDKRSQQITPLVKPSKIDFDEKYYFSPLDSFQNNNTIKINKGIIIHKILEQITLISYHPNKQSTYISLIDKLVKSHQTSQNINDEELLEIKDILLNIVNNPELEFLFDETSLNEVSISGTIDNPLEETKEEFPQLAISARIDKIIQYQSKVVIVDYKFATFKTSVPKYYKNQMLLYKELLKIIYKCNTIESYILYTIDGILIKV